MNEKTRKTAAIGLLGVYFGLLVLTAIVRNIYFLEMLREGYSIAYLQPVFELIPLLIQIGALLGSILVLRELLNRVTRCFFNRLVTGLVILPFINSIAVFFISRVISRAGYIYLISSGILLFAVIILMSGVGIISRNYSLNAYTSSKLRLFQTGIVLCYGSSTVSLFYNWLNSSLSSLSLLNELINWIGTICIVWGLIGIIKSDLVSESRKEEVFDRPDGGWLSRPVIGAVCFLGFLSCFVFLVPDICRLLNIELW